MFGTVPPAAQVYQANPFVAPQSFRPQLPESQHSNPAVKPITLSEPKNEEKSPQMLEQTTPGMHISQFHDNLHEGYNLANAQLRQTNFSQLLQNFSTPPNMQKLAQGNPGLNQMMPPYFFPAFQPFKSGFGQPPLAYPFFYNNTHPFPLSGGESGAKKSDKEEGYEKNSNGKRNRSSSNESKPSKKKSKYRGVFWHSRGKAWVSSIMVNGKTTHLGYYDCEVEAARVYDKEAIRLKGVTCAVNFPDSIQRFGGGKDVSTAGAGKKSTRHQRKRAERISKYRGVCWNKCNSSWKACIKIDGKNKHIGYFSDEKEAAKAYEVKAREVRGPAAKLNFPDESS